MTTLSLLDQLCRAHGVRGVAATHSSTLPILGYESRVDDSLQKETTPFGQAVIAFVRQNHVDDVLLAGRWSVAHDDAVQVHNDLVKTIHALKAAGARVWILRDVPRPGWNVPRVLATTVILGQHDPQGLTFPPTYYDSDAPIEDRILGGLDSTGATILDPTKLFLTAQGRLIVAEDGRALYFDEHHLSVAGAMKLRPILEPVFAGMGPAH
jgi:hypothetical protein